jgi:hypothetical protein
MRSVYTIEIPKINKVYSQDGWLLCLLGLCTVQSGRSSPTFQRCLLTPSSGSHRPDVGGSKHLWNVGKLLPDYMAQQPRRQPSSYSPPWQPEISLMTEAASTSETSVNFYQIPWSNNPEDSHLHTRRRENLKSHKAYSELTIIFI